jgi:uncharacterized protein (UPF0305 family)
LQNCSYIQKQLYICRNKNEIDMTQEMINAVIERVNEMKNNVEIQKIMMQFESTDDANNWLVKAAIATLMGVQN